MQDSEHRSEDWPGPFVHLFGDLKFRSCSPSKCQTHQTVALTISDRNCETSFDTLVNLPGTYNSLIQIRIALDERANSLICNNLLNPQKIIAPSPDWSFRCIRHHEGEKGGHHEESIRILDRPNSDFASGGRRLARSVARNDYRGIGNLGAFPSCRRRQGHRHFGHDPLMMQSRTAISGRPGRPKGGCDG